MSHDPLVDPLVDGIKKLISSDEFKKKVERTYTYSLKKGESGDPQMMNRMMFVYFLEIHNETRRLFVEYVEKEVKEIERLYHKGDKKNKLENQINAMLDVILFLKTLKNLNL